MIMLKELGLQTVNAIQVVVVRSLPMIHDEKLRVTTISDATIPENAIVYKLDLITVVLLAFLAKLAFQARRS